MLATIIVLVIALLVYMSTKVRMNQDKKPTIPEGLSDDLSVAKKQIEDAYPNDLGFITNIVRGSIKRTGANKMVKMHFADGFKYVQLISQDIYCIELRYVEDNGDYYDIAEFYTKWGNVLYYPNSYSYFSAPSPFSPATLMHSLLPGGYVFEPESN